MRKINTILFDFDGTIMDTNDVIINSWQHTFMTLEGKKRPVEEIVVTMGEPLPYTMEKFFPNIPVEESVNIYRSYHYDNFGELISVFPGMRELLDALKREKFTMALVTSRMKATTMEGLEKYDLKDYFDVILTCEDTDKHKPDPAPILITLDKLNKKPEESIMIGDTMFDILCARNAKVKSVLVDWSLAVNDEEKSGTDAPDHIIVDPMEMLHILKEYNR